MPTSRSSGAWVATVLQLGLIFLGLALIYRGENAEMPGSG